MFDMETTAKRNRMKGINASLYHRDRTGKDGTSPVLLSVCYDRKTTYIPLAVNLRPDQWDKKRKRVINHPRAATLNSFLLSLMGRVEEAVLDLQRNGGVRGWDVLKVKKALADILWPEEVDVSVLSVMRTYRDKCAGAGTVSVYKSTINRIEKYVGANAERLTFEAITPSWLEDFDRWLAKYCPSTNSRSIHMRNIRTVFNYALTHNLTDAKYPFRQFKIKHQATQPRTLTLEQMKLLWRHQPEDIHERYWLDIWKLMFTLIGINMADLWRLEKIVNGRINYERQKTGRLYSIKVEPETQALIDAHKGRKRLLDVSQRYSTVHTAMVGCNKFMKQIAEELELPPITTYTARYTWATLAASIDIPIEVISQALGHTYGLAVTLGYIMPDRRKVDEANRKILDLLKKETDKEQSNSRADEESKKG